MSSRPSLALFSARGRDSFSPQQQASLEAACQVRYETCLQRLGSAELALRAGDVELLGLTRRSTVDVGEELLARLPRLRGLAVYSSGLEWVDQAALARRQVALAHLPDYATEAVAEHALGLMLTLLRRIHLSLDRSRGLLPDSVSLRGQELRGRKVGLLGFGRIGRRVAELLQPFQVDLRAFDPLGPPPALSCDMPELLAHSQLLFLACPQQRGQGPLLGATELAQLPFGAMLVNVARPSLVDNNALLDALRNRRLAGYAVDEKLSGLDLEGLEPGRLLQTGHTAWYSDEALQRGGEGMVQALLGLAQALEPL